MENYEPTPFQEDSEDDELSDDEMDILKNEIAYNKFRVLMSNSYREEAYEVFKKNPELINYISLCDVPNDYDEIIRYIGKKEAEYFARAFAQRVNEILKSDIPDIRRVVQLIENKFLEDTLDELGDKHKRMLEEMEED